MVNIINQKSQHSIINFGIVDIILGRVKVRQIMTFKVSGGISFILSRDDVVTEKTVN